jgi:hypothetical protein
MSGLFDNPAAAWSAVAASFSALAAWSNYSLQLQNRREAARPFIELKGWELTREGEFAVIKISEIKNIGKGPALYTWLRPDFKEKPGSFTYERTLELQPGETHPLNAEIRILALREKESHSFINLEIGFNDLYSNRHRVIYDLLVSPGVVKGVPVLCEGLVLYDKYSLPILSSGRVRLYGRLRRINMALNRPIRLGRSTTTKTPRR